MIGDACHTCQIFIGCDLGRVILGLEEPPDTELFVQAHVGHELELHVLSDLDQHAGDLLAMEGVVRKLLQEARAPAPEARSGATRAPREPTRDEARRTGASREIKPLGALTTPRGSR